MSSPRTYQVRTYGCQMNVHDSERLTGLLEDAGYVAAAADTQADVVVFNTCAVRENADNKLYGNLSHLAPIKAANPDLQIAVGGCLAQKDRSTIVEKAPYVDVVFGTHNIGSLPVLLERARVQQQAQVEILESLEVFPSTLPTKRESAYAAWVSISVGCNNTCTFCIVPSLRGKEKDRRPGDVLAEIRALVDEGVSEVTLLGQNVNSYGVEFGDRLAFGKLLRACGEVDGLERVRFTSPHPADFTDDVIEAMAQTPNVMPQLHMPLQSGSDRLLKAMRRSYRQTKYLGIIERVRAAMPDAAITTDLIVGFPGETEADHQATLDVVREARFAGAFTFQYSPRPGTPAATWDDQVPKAVVQQRYERLVALVNDVAWAENTRLVGTTVELLVAEGEGRKDEATHRRSGRARDNRLVHFTDAEPGVIRPGDLVEAEVTYAAPHHLVSDAPVLTHRRTRSGDAWEQRRTPPKNPGVLLGSPTSPPYGDGPADRGRTPRGRETVAVLRRSGALAALLATSAFAAPGSVAAPTARQTPSVDGPLWVGGTHLLYADGATGSLPHVFGVGDLSADGTTFVSPVTVRNSAGKVLGVDLVAETSTGTIRTITRIPDHVTVPDLTLSSDGTQVAALVDSFSFGSSIWVYAVDGSASRQVYADDYDTIADLDWQPGGGLLSFTRGGLDVFTIPATGGAATNQTRQCTWAVDGEPGCAGALGFTYDDPSWSPDGAAWAVDTVADPHTDNPRHYLGVLALSTTSPRKVVELPADTGGWWPAQPLWSPDGTRIAYDRRPAGNWSAWIVEAQDGARVTRIDGVYGPVVWQACPGGACVEWRALTLKAVARATRVRVTGAVTPAPAAGAVTLTLETRGMGAWKVRATTTPRLSSTGGFAWTVKQGKASLCRVTAVVAGVGTPTAKKTLAC